MHYQIDLGETKEWQFGKPVEPINYDILPESDGEPTGYIKYDLAKIKGQKVAVVTEFSYETNTDMEWEAIQADIIFRVIAHVKGLKLKDVLITEHANIWE